MTPDPLTSAREALADWTAWMTAVGHDARTIDGRAAVAPAFAAAVDHLRATLAEADRLRAVLTPPTDATRLPHEWPTDTRDPLVCTHGCGAEPGDVLVEDECPRRLRRALDAAAGPEPGITWDEALHIESTVARGALDALERHGHTPHCAVRQAHGDGECECRAGDAERVEWGRLAKLFTGAVPMTAGETANMLHAFPRLLAALAAAEAEIARLRAPSPRRGPHEPDLDTKAGRAEYARKLLRRLNLTAGAEHTLEMALEAIGSQHAADRAELRVALAAAEGERDASLARVRELEAEVARLRRDGAYPMPRAGGGSASAPKPEAVPWRWERLSADCYYLEGSDVGARASVCVEGDGYRPYIGTHPCTYAADLPAALAILRAKLGAGVPDLDLEACR